jgi:hypothetical protein
MVNFEELIEKVAKGELDAEMAANLVVGTEEELAPYVSQRVFEVKEGMKYLGDFSPPNIKHERKPFPKIEFVAKEVKDKSFKYEITEGGVNVLKATYGLTDDQIKGIREGSVKPGSDVWKNLFAVQTGSLTNKGNKGAERFDDKTVDNNFTGGKPIARIPQTVKERWRKRRERLLREDDEETPPEEEKPEETKPEASPEEKPERDEKTFDSKEENGEEEIAFNVGALVDEALQKVLTNVDVNAEFEPKLFGVEGLPEEVDLAVALACLYPLHFKQGSEAGYLKRVR